ncbi:MAG TPA: phenylalanine--tRNA ligase subunit beta, partial [Chloroflexia bacterium]|nr:phenylalanine--tRNA ligase subunit beta [Chloroflexia bacterium]
WQDEGPPAESLLQVEIEDADLCPRYTGAVVRGVKVGPSPAWMQRRLTLAGMRPINNVVDITNYVMLEMGQPMHPFSYDAVEGHKIIVRRAREGEKITTLDHVERTLDPKMLTICDVNRPVALAGVMGGADSEIEEGSSDVLLESAHFESRSIRRTARLFKLPSEAAYRFERFVDPNLTVPAMKRAAELMRQIAGGTIARGYVDEYPRPLKPVRIHFYTSEVERLLGIKVPPTQIADLLRRLEFEVDLPHNADAVGQDTTMLVDVPSYRNDVSLPADLVEEVARLVGYDLIPETLLTGGLPPQEVNYPLATEERLRDLMVACGIDEVITYNVTYSADVLRLAAIEKENERGGPNSGAVYQSWDRCRPPVTIVNPLSSRQDIMRPTMLPNLLDALRLNLRAIPESPVKIFEIGKIFLTRTEEEVEARKEEMEQERERYPRLKMWEPVPGEDRLPLELRRLSGMMSGPREPRSRFHPNVGENTAQIDFFDAKGVIEELLHHLHIENVEWVAVDAPILHPGRSAMLRAAGTELGVVGELHPSVAREWELPDQRVCLWDIDVDALMTVLPERASYSEVSAHQPVRQDMAFVLRESVPTASVAAAIKKAGGEAITEVVLFDIYKGKPVPEGHRSLAFAVTFSSPDRLITEEDVARLRKKIAGALSHEFQAEMRT